MINNSIAKYRKIAGYTQQDMADMLGVQRPLVSKLERGHINPNIRTVLKIAKFLNVSLDQLYGAKENDGKNKLKSQLELVEEKLDDFKNQLNQLQYVVMAIKDDEGQT